MRVAAGYQGMAEALEAGGKAQQAYHAYVECVSLNPTNPDTYNSLGVFLHNHKQTSEAIKVINAGIHIAPDQARLWDNRGVVLESMQQLAQAQVAFERTIMLDPTRASGYAGLGVCMLYSGWWLGVCMLYSGWWLGVCAAAGCCCCRWYCRNCLNWSRRARRFLLLEIWRHNNTVISESKRYRGSAGRSPSTLSHSSPVSLAVQLHIHRLPVKQTQSCKILD